MDNLLFLPFVQLFENHHILQSKHDIIAFLVPKETLGLHRVSTDILDLEEVRVLSEET